MCKKCIMFDVVNNSRLEAFKVGYKNNRLSILVDFALMIKNFKVFEIFDLSFVLKTEEL